MIPILKPEHYWYCPNCTEEDVTYEPRPHSRYHTCRGLRGISAPFLPVGTKAKVEAKDREDYQGNEILTTDINGRPVMSVVTTRDDGQDTMVFAPLARADLRVSHQQE